MKHDINKKGACVVLGNFSPDAQGSFVPTSEEDALGTIYQLMISNEEVVNNGNPCEDYNVLLDGNANLVDAVQYVGFVSKQISNADGSFDSNIIIELKADGIFAAQGLTIVFDRVNNIHPTKCLIHWYLDDEEVESIEKEIADSEFVIQTETIQYNSLKLEFSDLNISGNRLRIESIQYGHYYIVWPRDIKKISLIQETDLISASLPISTTDLILNADGIDVFFQEKQPIYTYYDNNLISLTFIETAKKTSKNEYNIKSEDSIGVMNDVMFNGGVYEDALAVEVLQDIFDTAGVKYDIDESLNDVTVSGYLPYSSCRNALMKVCFGCGAIVDTSYSDVVKVRVLKEETPENIISSHIYDNPQYEVNRDLASFKMTYRQYKKLDEEVEIYHNESDEIEDKEFILSEPMHSIRVYGTGRATQRGNYVKVTTLLPGDKVLGKKYSYTDTNVEKKNNSVLSIALKNAKEIKDISIISLSKVDNIVDLCYNYYNTKVVADIKVAERNIHLSRYGFVKYGQAKYGEAKYGQVIIEQTGEKQSLHLGDFITHDSGYLGLHEGRIQKQTFDLDGNFLSKKCTVR